MLLRAVKKCQVALRRLHVFTFLSPHDFRPAVKVMVGPLTELSSGLEANDSWGFCHYSVFWSM
jgi:hypothetical protein